MIMLLEYSSV